MDRQVRLERIYETIRDIPRGSVASYGQVAEIAGIPRGARQVGWALKHAPDDADLPWHRVLTASGKIAFETGSKHFRKHERLWKPGSAWDER
jgi:methylated-DNA-protein-cysteine methyltransferase-like protein